ncbi:uncharacterized protein LOC111699762 [Eurytemora carolleeae]|nr:uncharacterized protein LOC111699762 [Eurytemora carolleeae]|eukprot:XP_023326264.1 uncharacterized protein LOC111699762 [Eurytemora affinis]
MECYPVRELARSCTRTICCLEHPAFFAFDSTRSLLFISEPKRNRIGIYDANTFVFKSWLTCPDYTLRNPRNIVVAGNYLVILQSNGIIIFLIDEKAYSRAISFQFIPGCFSGLCWVEATHELASVKSGNEQCEQTIRRYRKDLANSFIYVGSIEIHNKR